MQKKITNRHLQLFLCIMLVAMMALATAGCNGGKDDVAKDSAKTEGVKTDGNVLGEGDTQFTFTVVDGENNESKFEIHTDKKTVGEALLELDLIAGDEGDYGLFVKTALTGHFILAMNMPLQAWIPQRLKKDRNIPLKLKSNETVYQRDCCIWNAWGRDVCFQDDYGTFAEYTSAWRVYCRFYSCISAESAVYYLYLCVPERYFQWFCSMVDSLSLCMDCSLGSSDAASEKYAEKGTARCVHGSVRCTWFFVWNAVCPGAGNSFWFQLSGDGGMDYCRVTVGFYTWYQQFFLRHFDYAACLCITFCGEKRLIATVQPAERN